MASLDPIACPVPKHSLSSAAGFERLKREQRDLEQSFFRFIDAGCDQGDLEWALSWVPLGRQSNVVWKSSQMRKEIKDFLRRCPECSANYSPMLTNVTQLTSPNIAF
jgi:hypothetical protein